MICLVSVVVFPVLFKVVRWGKENKINCLYMTVEIINWLLREAHVII